MPQKIGDYNKSHKHGKPIGGNKQRRDAVASFTDPLTPKTAKKELKAATRLQFRPQQRELKSEQRAEKEYRHRAKDYFHTYGQAVNTAEAETKAAYDDAYSKINAQGQQTSANDEALRQKIEADAQADAQKRGATYTPSSTATQASANRRATVADYAGAAALQGATAQSYLADKKRIGAGEKRNQLLLSHKRQRSINADRRELAKAKGDFATDYNSRQRETERQFYLSQAQLAQTAKGQKITAKNAKRSARVSLQNSRRSAATQRRGQDITARGQDITAANNRADNRRENRDSRSMRQDRAHDNAHPNAGDSPSTYTVQKAVAVLRSNLKPGVDLTGSARQQAIDYLVAHGYSKKVAQQAVNRLSGGGGPRGGGPQRGA